MKLNIFLVTPLFALVLNGCNIQTAEKRNGADNNSATTSVQVKFEDNGYLDQSTISGIKDEHLKVKAISAYEYALPIVGIEVWHKEFLKEACSKFKNKIALGLDAKDGRLSVSGWKENLNIKTLDFLKEVNNFGVSRIIYTDINRDGTKGSPNLKETIKIAEISKCPVIISGGVSSISDIKKAKELNNRNIEGIIVGKAIYDGDIKLDELAREIDA